MLFFSARLFESPYFFHIIQIMYLYVLKYVAKYESHRSLPPNPKQRQALKKSLAAKTTE